MPYGYREDARPQVPWRHNVEGADWKSRVKSHVSHTTGKCLLPCFPLCLYTSHGLEQPCESLHPDIHLLFAREAKGGAHKRTG